ncbi:hypothetical protein HMPREF0058_0046 [Actinomyces urogenitalis DSM 15434]|uniref:Uncharacterized protein n=1 Tax=Actinomyces urogenitalis DSM 15434 TaxID=525246 RepID=C0W2F2_9ACTO|nr:hypothetical protein HMPREF0058_0046 [Actinomyces urogenitalis DSM 15434]
MDMPVDESIATISRRSPRDRRIDLGASPSPTPARWPGGIA